MDARYATWIAEYERKVRDVRWRCAEATLEMQQALPELQRVRGHVKCARLGPGQPHWWLTAPDGSIVDPTAAQFVMPEYEPLDESGPVPTGKCMNCGLYVWSDSDSGDGAACSKTCLDELRAYYNDLERTY
jgi:hypothetical protein